MFDCFFIFSLRGQHLKVNITGIAGYCQAHITHMFSESYRADHVKLTAWRFIASLNWTLEIMIDAVHFSISHTSNSACLPLFLVMSFGEMFIIGHLGTGGVQYREGP